MTTMSLRNRLRSVRAWLRLDECLVDHYEQVVEFYGTVNRVLMTARDVSVRVSVDMVPILVHVLKQCHKNKTPDLQSLHIWHTWHDFKPHDEFDCHLHPLRTIRARKFSFEFCLLNESQGYQIHTYDNGTEDYLPELVKLSPATKNSIKELKSLIEKTDARPQSEPFCTRDQPW